MEHMGNIGAAVFWLGVFGVAIVAILTPVIRHREVQKTLRTVIEQGQALDPALVERVLSADPVPERAERPMPVYQGLLIGGAITVACGLGLAVLGMFLAMTDEDIIYPLGGVASLVGIIGVALLILSRILKPRPGE